MLLRKSRRREVPLAPSTDVIAEAQPAFGVTAGDARAVAMRAARRPSSLRLGTSAWPRQGATAPIPPGPHRPTSHDVTAFADAPPWAAEAAAWRRRADGVGTLADRGRSEPCPGAAQAGSGSGLPQPADWPVVAGLLDAPAAIRTPQPAPPADAGSARWSRTQWRPTAQHALAGSYTPACFLLDAPISAALAVELRLLDRVGEPEISPRLASVTAGSASRSRSGAALYPGRARAEKLCSAATRLILGETGSGKTASGDHARGAGASRTSDSPVGVALVIDPKDEIAAAIDGQVRPQFARSTSTGTPSIWRRGRHSVQPHLEAGDVIDGRQRTALPGHLPRPGECGPHARRPCVRSGRDPYWEREGARLGETVLAFVLSPLQPRSPVCSAPSNEPGALAGMADVTAWSHLVGVGERAGLVQPLRRNRPDSRTSTVTWGTGRPDPPATGRATTERRRAAWRTRQR